MPCSSRAVRSAAAGACNRGVIQPGGLLPPARRCGYARAERGISTERGRGAMRGALHPAKAVWIGTVALVAALLGIAAWLLAATGARATETVTATFHPTGAEQTAATRKPAAVGERATSACSRAAPKRP